MVGWLAARSNISSNETFVWTIVSQNQAVFLNKLNIRESLLSSFLCPKDVRGFVKILLIFIFVCWVLLDFDESLFLKRCRLFEKLNIARLFLKKRLENCKKRFLRDTVTSCVLFIRACLTNILKRFICRSCLNFKKWSVAMRRREETNFLRRTAGVKAR